MRRIGALLLVALSGCSGSNQSSAAGWPFDPVQFFTGHTTGKARLHLITGAVRNVAVDSHGEPDAHGGLVLVQAIAEDGKPARTRRWTLHPAGANRWTGTLTDAQGPVVIERTPTDVVIRYRMKGGLQVEQHLQLPPGGVASNHMSISRFGVRVASLDEQIRKAHA